LTYAVKDDADVKLLAFGHGLSYTSFGLEKPKLSGNLSESSSLHLELTVANKGSLPGKEVVQLYIKGPSGSSVERSAKTLEAFTKTSLLQPGASETVTLNVGRRAFSYWSEQTKAWEVEAGSYQILLASSSDSIQQTLDYTVKDGFVWKGLL
jgi:beta-glucosidase